MSEKEGVSRWTEPEVAATVLTLGIPVYGGLLAWVALAISSSVEVPFFQTINQPLPALIACGIIPGAAILITAALAGLSTHLGLVLVKRSNERLRRKHQSAFERRSTALKNIEARISVQQALPPDQRDLAEADAIDAELEQIQSEIHTTAKDLRLPVELDDEQEGRRDYARIAVRFAFGLLIPAAIVVGILWSITYGFAFLVSALFYNYLITAQEVRPPMWMALATVVVGLLSGMALNEGRVASASTSEFYFVEDAQIEDGTYVAIPQNGDQIMLIRCPKKNSGESTVDLLPASSVARAVPVPGMRSPGTTGTSLLDLIRDEEARFGFQPACPEPKAP